MSLSVKIKKLLKLKIATAVFITASVAAFATLGDGGKKSNIPAGKTVSVKNFSLRSTHNYRANNLFKDQKPRYITLNTTVTYQKGNSTYIVPLKKKVLLDKVKFNPASPSPSRF